MSEFQEHKEVRVEQVLIPWLGPSLNKIWAGMHWAKRKKIADEGHLACLVARTIPKFEGAVHLEFQPMVSGRRLDIVNYAVTIKVIEDGLVNLGILRQDGANDVLSHRTYPPKKAKESGMLVTIREEL